MDATLNATLAAVVSNRVFIFSTTVEDEDEVVIDAADTDADAEVGMGTNLGSCNSS